MSAVQKQTSVGNWVAYSSFTRRISQAAESQHDLQCSLSNIDTYQNDYHWEPPFPRNFTIFALRTKSVLGDPCTDLAPSEDFTSCLCS